MKITKDKVTYIKIGDLEEKIGSGCKEKFDYYSYCLENSDCNEQSWYASDCYVLASLNQFLDDIIRILSMDDYEKEFVEYPNGWNGEPVKRKLTLEDRIKMFNNAVKLKTRFEGKTGHDLPFVLFEWM